MNLREDFDYCTARIFHEHCTVWNTKYHNFSCCTRVDPIALKSPEKTVNYQKLTESLFLLVFGSPTTWWTKDGPIIASGQILRDYCISK